MARILGVLGLAYGDEGKGATVDKLCRTNPVDLIVRFNGGHQACHHVHDPKLGKHAFHQFGSGSFTHDVRTYLSRFMLVEPISMMNEAKAFHGLGGQDLWDRTAVDPNCLIVTPYHMLINQCETSLAKIQNSTGMGIGVARAMQLGEREGPVITANDLLSPSNVKEALEQLNEMAVKAYTAWLKGTSSSAERNNRIGFLVQTYANKVMSLIDRYEQWPVMIGGEKWLENTDCVLFEGAQGVLLDEEHGQEGHNTWTKCDFTNMDILLKEADLEIDDDVRVGCMRTFMTRHGAGDLPYGDDKAYIKKPEALADDNKISPWCGSMRYSPLDLDVIKEGLRLANGITYIALNHCDLIPNLKDSDGDIYVYAPDEDGDWEMQCWQAGDEPGDDYACQIENVLEKPIRMVANGRTHFHRVSRQEGQVLRDCWNEAAHSNAG